MKEKNVVIIGGNGHLGSAAVQGALQVEADVTILSRHAEPMNERTKAVTGSITDKESLRSSLQDSDAVVVSVEADWTASGLNDIYVQGMRNVVQVAPDDSHIVFMGNIGVTDVERMPDYNRAKLEAESILRKSGKSYTIIRPSWIVSSHTGAKLEQGDQYTGRRDDVSHDQLANAIAAILENKVQSIGKTFELYGSNEDINDWSRALDALKVDQ